jgi:hypothetical protein
MKIFSTQIRKLRWIYENNLYHSMKPNRCAHLKESCLLGCYVVAFDGLGRNMQIRYQDKVAELRSLSGSLMYHLNSCNSHCLTQNLLIGSA